MSQIKARDKSRALDWRTSAITATVVSATALPFFWNRDFGWFLIGLLGYVPMLLCALVCALGIALFNSEIRLQIVACIASSAIALVLLFTVTRFEHNRIRFLFWYPFHWRTVQELSVRDGIIADWDSWGGLGWGHDSYLVANFAENLERTGAPEKWLTENGYDCERVTAQKIWRELYVLTTTECPLH